MGEAKSASTMGPCAGPEKQARELGSQMANTEAHELALHSRDETVTRPLHYCDDRMKYRND